MPDYRRNRVPGGTYFFTVYLLERSSLLVTHIDTRLCAEFGQARILTICPPQSALHDEADFIRRKALRFFPLRGLVRRQSHRHHFGALPKYRVLHGEHIWA
jgi:hypothetical protein